MTEHALLSASSAHRWMACTPSARLEEQFPEQTSEYAEEGRTAHVMAETFLKVDLNMVPHKALDFLPSLPYFTPEMDEYIYSYASAVLEKINALKNPFVHLEHRLDFSNYVPEGFGTGDVVIISDGVLEIIDLKYGKGIPVSAINNPQMRLYALGALNDLGFMYDISTVRMTIIQPRLDSISTEELTVSQLTEWAEVELKPRATLAHAGEGEFIVGEHCQFCRAKVKCRARAEHNLELAKLEFRDPQILSDMEIPDVLGRIDELVNWANAVKEYAYQKALEGHRWNGWKLVEGRANRKYSDDIAAAQMLLEKGYTREDVFDIKVKGITAMQQSLGKKAFEELLADYLVKPPGSPALVPVSDRREEINSLQKAIQEFS